MGGFVDGVGIDPLDLRIPADLRMYNLQQALVVKVADEALRDAGFSRTPAEGRSAPPPRRIAVVVNMEIEPYTHARIARYGLGDFLRREFDRAGSTRPRSSGRRWPRWPGTRWPTRWAPTRCSASSAT